MSLQQIKQRFEVLALLVTNTRVNEFKAQHYEHTSFRISRSQVNHKTLRVRASCAPNQNLPVGGSVQHIMQRKVERGLWMLCAQSVHEELEKLLPLDRG